MPRERGKITIHLDVPIPSKKSNFFVILPRDPQKWVEEMTHSKEVNEEITMAINNLGHGAGCIEMSFWPGVESFGRELGGEEENGFGFFIDLPTAESIHHALGLAIEEFSGGREREEGKQFAAAGA